MAEATPTTQGFLESLVHLVDVLTDPTVVVLVLLIVFRKQIGPHVSKIAQELASLLSRMQSARVGSTSFVFSPTDLRTMAIEYEPELLRRILLQLPESPAPAALEDDDERETEEETAAESAQLVASLQALRQSRREEPTK
jgi:hypothetical protein